MFCYISSKVQVDTEQNPRQFNEDLSENWVVYTYYNEKSRRAELGSLELFEGKTQSNATVFSSLHNTVSPLVERQSYILGPAFVTALKDTVTEKGITTKNLLMATASGAVYNIPR